MKIGCFDTYKAPLIIAEVGNNHEGNISLAFQLVDAAISAGVDVVKLQVIDPTRLVTMDNTARIAQLQRFRLPMDVIRSISRKVRESGRLFAASVFDIESLEEVLPHLDIIKVASGDINFFSLLALAVESQKPIIMSTGMSTLEEIGTSVEYISRKAGVPLRELAQRLALLHCVSLYPTPIERINLSAITTLQAKFGLTVGFSDHTIGLEAAVAAVALGARIIEKHFTLDKQQSEFRDHIISANPEEMTHLSRIIRLADGIIGEGSLSETRPDREISMQARRSIVASRFLAANHRLCASDLEFLRPGTGLPPNECSSILGRTLSRSIEKHAQISLDILN